MKFKFLLLAAALLSCASLHAQQFDRVTLYTSNGFEVSASNPLPVTLPTGGTALSGTTRTVAFSPIVTGTGATTTGTWNSLKSVGFVVTTGSFNLTAHGQTLTFIAGTATGSFFQSFAPDICEPVSYFAYPSSAITVFNTQ